MESDLPIPEPQLRKAQCDTVEDANEGLTRREVLQVTGAAAAYMMVPSIHGSVMAQGEPAQAETTRTVTFTVNSKPVTVDLDPRTSVLDMLRERLALTGTKKGCNQGACGACTVLVDGRRINACLALAIMYEGSEITTIEGLADGEQLHPLQAAFIEHDGFQCGYCTSGQIMSGVACIREGHANSPEEISAWMSGNICRCGAYPGIVAAVQQAALEERT